MQIFHKSYSVSWLAVPTVFLAFIYCTTNKSLKKELFWLLNNHKVLTKSFKRKKPLKLGTLHLWHLPNFLLKYVKYTERLPFVSFILYCYLQYLCFTRFEGPSRTCCPWLVILYKDKEKMCKCACLHFNVSVSFSLTVSQSLIGQQ